jgi:hypothetical protein
LIPGATNNYYVPTQSGNYTVVTLGSNGCHSIASLPRVVTIVGVARQLSSDWSIYPNPSKGSLRISHPDLGAESFVISVADARGKRVAMAINADVLDLSSLQNGMYFISIHQGDRLVTTQKIALIH